MPKKSTPKKRARKKDTLAIIRAVEQAGGTVTWTGKSHLRIVGPAGIAIVGSDPANNSMAQTLKTIEKYSGLSIKV